MAKYRYYCLDMAEHKHKFKTKKEAKAWAKWINEKTAMCPYIYKMRQVV